MTPEPLAAVTPFSRGGTSRLDRSSGDRPGGVEARLGGGEPLARGPLGGLLLAGAARPARVRRPATARTERRRMAATVTGTPGTDCGSPTRGPVRGAGWDPLRGSGGVRKQSGLSAGEAALAEVDRHGVAVADVAREQCRGEPVADLALHEPAQRPGAVRRVVPLLGEPRLRRLGHLEGDPPVVQPRRERPHLELDDPAQLGGRQGVEHDDLVEAVEELGLEGRAHGGHDGLPLGARLHRRVDEVLRAEVGGHDEDDVAEVDGAALPVGEPPVVEHLEQDVEGLRVGLLHLVEEHDRVRAAADRLGELTALLVADVAGRGADEPGHRVPLGVLAHVDAHHRALVVEEEVRQRLGELGLADTGGPEEQEAPGGAVGVRDARASAAHGIRHRTHRLGLPDEPGADERLHREQLLGLALQEAAGGDAGPRRDDLRDVVGTHALLDHQVGGCRGRLGLLCRLQLGLQRRDLAVANPRGVAEVAVALEALGLRPQVVEPRFEVTDPVQPRLLGLPARRQGGELLRLLGEVGPQALEPLGRRLVGLLREVQLLHAQPVDRAPEDVDLDGAGVDLHPEAGGRLVDEVDRLVGQLAARDVAVGERGRRDEGAVLDLDLVVRLVALLETAQDRDGVLDARLPDEDLLEAALQRRVLLDVLAELVEGRRTDEAQLAAGEHRLEHVARVHRGLAGGPGADDGVQLVDEGHDLTVGRLDLLEDGLETLLELAAVLRARDHGGEVERDEALAAQRLRHVTVDDALGQSLDDRGLADAGVADEHGVVLRPAREHLHDAADLVVAPDDRVEPAVAGRLGEVGAVGRESLALGLGVLPGHLGTGAQVLEPLLERARVALDGALLEEGEQQQVRGEVGVAAGGHQRGGVLEHRERGLPETGGRDALAGAARHPGEHPSGGRGDALGGRAGSREEGGRGGALLLGEREREVRRRDLGVAGGLGRALGDGERLGHLRGGLQLHAGLSSDEAGGRGSSGATCPKLSVFRSTPLPDRGVTGRTRGHRLRLPGPSLRRAVRGRGRTSRRAPG